MNESCPLCHQPLTSLATHFHCADCNHDFAKQAICPDCRQPVQILKACGAVDYFCPAGHGLISKKRIEFLPLSETL